MNPLLFADWGRMNRLFTRLMWTVATVMACAVFALVVSAGHPAHAASSVHASGAAAGARAVNAAADDVPRTGAADASR